MPAFAGTGAGKGRNVSFAFNREDIKGHDEGGTLIGARPQGPVAAIDNVISADASVREQAELIHVSGATTCADRMEKSDKASESGQAIECCMADHEKKRALISQCPLKLLSDSSTGMKPVMSRYSTQNRVRMPAASSV